MADDNADQPQSAIPPKIVPPQARLGANAEGAVDSPTVRRQPAFPAGSTSSSGPIPRTVRLKPIGAAGAASGQPAVQPLAGTTAPADPESAADAVKRMTARIMMMSNEGDAQTGKKRTREIPSGAESGAKKATTPRPSVGSAENAATFKKQTLHIQMATTAPIPAFDDMPKTIKIRPSSGGGHPPITGTQPISQMDSQQPVGKAKTSRIPLDSAMSVPQSSGAAESSDGAPKTIKLKRPGEMSTIKVSVPGAGAAAHAGGAQTSDNASITQKKTIRVKRPMAPAAASVAEGGAMEESDGSSRVAMPHVAAVSAAPERGTGWFVAVAAACIVVALVLTGIMFVQRYGSAPNTKLDVQFQQG